MTNKLVITIKRLSVSFIHISKKSKVKIRELNYNLIIIKHLVTKLTRGFQWLESTIKLV